MPFEDPLDAETMRIIIQLRRLLLDDHGVDIDLEDSQVMENLFDAAREARDRKAEQLAHALCDHLRALHYQVSGPGCLERLQPGFRSPLHERFVGANPGRVYRGQTLEGEPATEPVSEGGGPDETPRREVIYRGQRVRA